MRRLVLQFVVLTWIDGRAGGLQPTFTFACSDGPCWAVVGAVAVTPEPKLVAQSDAAFD